MDELIDARTGRIICTLDRYEVQNKIGGATFFSLRDETFLELQLKVFFQKYTP